MNFAISEAKLKKEHRDFLRDTVFFGTLTSDPMASIAIIGHTDSTGSKSFNDRLAKQRAQETEKALRQMGKHNLRINSVTGKGANQSIAQNDRVFGRAENRRVEILVTPWKPKKPVPELLTERQKGMKPFVVREHSPPLPPAGSHASPWGVAHLARVAPPGRKPGSCPGG